MNEDILTGFYSRDELNPYLNDLVSSEKSFTIGMVDLNHFKGINDKYGHMFGDSVLKYVSSTIKLTFTDRGTIFRYGGDEFVIVFPEQDKKYAAILFKICNRNLRKRPFLYRTKLLKISVSYGLASYPQDAIDIDSLIHKADMAMYCAKKIGKGVVVDVAKINIMRSLVWLKKTAILGIVLVLGGFFIFRPVTLGIKSYLKHKVYTQTEEQMLNYMCEVVFKNGYILKGTLVERDSKTITVLISMAGEAGKMKIDQNLIQRYRTFLPKE